MVKKIIGILPESIAGRLIMTGLFKGFEAAGFKVDIVDKLSQTPLNALSVLKISDYEFMISYDFVAVEFKTELNLGIKTVNFFSDVIESKTSGPYWSKYYDKLKDESNIVFYWDEALCKKADRKKIANLHYLPHAVDIQTYKNMHVKPEYDVMFAGRLTYGTRVERFLNIVKALPDVKFALYCFEKHLNEACEGLSDSDKALLHGMYKGFIDTEEKMAMAINKSKIVINFTSQGESSLNYRLFQVLACEKYLLTDYRAELDTLFEVGKNVVYYENDEDLVSKISAYLASPAGYNFILQNGRNSVEKAYNTDNAAQKILKTLY